MKWFLALLILCSMLLLNGCGFRDIDNRFFVINVGIDQPENEKMKYKVVLKLAIPSAEIKAGASEFLIETEESHSISEAIRNIKSRVDREIDFGHAKVILFGESLLDRDIENELDWFLRRRDIQKIAWVAVAKPSVEEILNIKPKIERIPGNSMYLSFGDKGSQTPYIVTEYLFEFYRDMKNEGVSAIMPIIETTSGELFDIRTAAVFDQQRRAITLNSEETKLLNLSMGQHENTSIKIEVNGEFYVISTDIFKSNYKLEREKSKDFIDFNVKVIGVLEEEQSHLTNEEIKKYGEKAENQLKSQLEDLLVKLRDTNVDPLGFGLRYRATQFNNSKKMVEWQKIYPNIDFRVNVSVDVKGTGVIE